MSYIGNTATQQAFTPAVDFFNGNGSTTAFTLSRPVASVAQVQAVISNVPQKPGDAFTVSGNTITFTSAPPAGTSNIYVYYTSPITQVIAPGQGTVSPTSLSTGGPSWDTSGNVTTTGTVNNLTVGRGAGSVSTNTAVGASALNTNSTGSRSTVLGYQAAYTSNAEGITAVGHRALYANTTGVGSVAIGASIATVSGSPLESNTTGSYNTAVGTGSLGSNTTASNNTAVGYQAGYSNTTGSYNTLVGLQAGYSISGSGNTLNTCVGFAAGYSITTGTKNTILGSYNGNQSGLDIRTASNKVVLSDGDGNPVFVYGAYPTGGGISSSGGYAYLGLGGTGSTGTGALFLNGESAAGWGAVIGFSSNSASIWGGIGRKGWFDGGSDNFLMCRNSTGGVYLNGSSATSWTAVSDERLKENFVDITDAAAKVSTLRAVVGNYTFDDEKNRKPFLIAQDVQAVLPEAVSSSLQIKGDDTEYLGVSYTEVIPLLVAAIKELKAEFDAYKEAHP